MKTSPVRPLSASFYGTAMLLHILLASLPLCADEPSAPKNTPGHDSETVRGRISLIPTELRFSAEKWATTDVEPVFYSWAITDFNGDGLDDLITDDGTTTPLGVRYSNGRNFEVGPILLKPRPEARLTGAVDLDGNGCGDLILWSAQRRLLSVGYSDCREIFKWSDSDADLPLYIQVYPERAEDQRLPVRIATNFPGWKNFGIDTKNLLQPVEIIPPPPSFAPPPHIGPSYGDMNGDGALEQIFPAGGGNVFVRMTGRNTPELVASFENFIPSFAVMGDLNNDSRDDLLAFSRNSHEWWVGISTGESFIDLPLSPPFPIELDYDWVQFGDVDGDSLIDMVTRPTGSKEWWVSHRRAPSFAGPAKILLSADGFRRTIAVDSKGYFSIPRRDLPVQLEPVGPFDFAPPVRTLGPRVGSRRAISFGAVAKEGETNGAAVRLAGVAAGPFVCSGFRDHSYSGDNLSVSPDAFHARYFRWGRQLHDCGSDYAMLEAVGGERHHSQSSLNYSVGVCCRVPGSDVFSGGDFQAQDSCPLGSVVVGFIPEEERNKTGSGLLCRRINTSRYQLSDPSPGRAWGLGLSMRGEARRLFRARLPLAFRVGAGRIKYNSWESHGCVGEKPGMFLTEVHGKGCSSLVFRELQYAGLPGDSPRGSSVPMFPDCETAPDPYNPLRGCRSTPP